jgi:hypothetical protein
MKHETTYLIRIIGLCLFIGAPLVSTRVFQFRPQFNPANNNLCAVREIARVILIISRSAS